MNFRVYVPERRWIPNGELVGLAERANKRLGRPLESGIGAEELLDQAELEGFCTPVPEGSLMDAHDERYYTRADLVAIARRTIRRQRREVSREL